MPYTKFKTLFKLVIFTFILGINSLAISQNVTLEQDPNFEQLLNEKRKINASITVNDRWKIQIFTGDNENAKKALLAFRKEVKTYDATIVFQTPVYKVWVGNFKTRIEAERNLKELKIKYPTAFLIKPNK
ncbi:SPOR domain-containing protein [Flavobacterium sp.]|uniref:SPOR domain-containing protein n=1 Tax=Flavobacterium sp. TaxID=239 RepID=UPI002FD8C98E